MDLLEILPCSSQASPQLLARGVGLARYVHGAELRRIEAAQRIRLPSDGSGAVADRGSGATSPETRARSTTSLNDANCRTHDRVDRWMSPDLLRDAGVDRVQDACDPIDVPLDDHRPG